MKNSEWLAEKFKRASSNAVLSVLAVEALILVLDRLDEIEAKLVPPQEEINQ